MCNRVYIIAEAGVNHNGSLELAKRLVDAAKKAGADAIKFQTFKAENLVTKGAAKAEYQIKNTGNDNSQYQMLKELELSNSDFIMLKQYCDAVKIEFLSTAFDLESIDFLFKLGINRFKIPSGEINNYPYLKKIAQMQLPIILSTGMSTLDDVGCAVKLLQTNGMQEIALLHCTTEYPAAVHEINLRAMTTMKNEFGLTVGYSDHTEGIEIPIAAVAMGAKIIEKHFTLDKSMEGPDHKASLEPDELKMMINGIRKVEMALGDGIKKPTDAELKNILIVRKSVVAKRKINKGEAFSDSNLTVKRPGMGISPMKWNDVIGKIASKDFEADEMIKL